MFMEAKILVVEDEDAVAQDIIECLTEFDYEVVGRADSAQGAIELAEEEEPDLVLMDMERHRNLWVEIDKKPSWLC